MSTITIEIDETLLQRFQTPATLLGIKPEEFARLSIEEFLARPDHEFENIVSEIIEDHRDVVERLAR